MSAITLLLTLLAYDGNASTIQTTLILITTTLATKKQISKTSLQNKNRQEL